LTGTSYVMLSANTWIASASAISAPRSVVRGSRRRIPASVSAQPVKAWYAGDAPSEAQRTPIGERSPYGSTRRMSDGYGICSGTTLMTP